MNRLAFDSPSQEADSRCLHLVRKHLDIGQACGVVDSDMHLLVASTP
jgi:hypothetical protein